MKKMIRKIIIYLFDKYAYDYWADIDKWLKEHNF